MTTAAPPPSTNDSTDALRLARHIWVGTGYGAVCSLDRNQAEPQMTTRYAASQQAEWLIGQAFQQDADGRDAYLCAHLLTDTRRVKANAVPAIWALWSDIDAGLVPTSYPPTALVASSPGRHHGYWRLARPVTPEQAEELNWRIAHANGHDMSGWDLTQLLRIPGTRNHKYDPAPTVRLVYCRDDAPYDPDELDHLLPPALAGWRGNAKPPRRPAAGADTALSDGDPPVVLDGDDLDLWHGRGSALPLTEGGTADRSAALYRIALALWRANMTEGGIVAALTERDATLGWNKYTDRPDEYARIVAKVGELPRSLGGIDLDDLDNDNGEPPPATDNGTADHRGEPPAV